jgi:hypothetical protein
MLLERRIDQVIRSISWKSNFEEFKGTLLTTMLNIGWITSTDLLSLDIFHKHLTLKDLLLTAWNKQKLPLDEFLDLLGLSSDYTASNQEKTVHRRQRVTFATAELQTYFEHQRDIKERVGPYLITRVSKRGFWFLGDEGESFVSYGQFEYEKGWFGVTQKICRSFWFQTVGNIFRLAFHQAKTRNHKRAYGKIKIYHLFSNVHFDRNLIEHIISFL